MDSSHYIWLPGWGQSFLYFQVGASQLTEHAATY